MVPVQVSVKNQEQFWQAVYTVPQNGTKRNYYKEGDRVRIAQARKRFKKGYMAK